MFSLLLPFIAIYDAHATRCQRYFARRAAAIAMPALADYVSPATLLMRHMITITISLVFRRFYASALDAAFYLRPC